MDLDNIKKAWQESNITPSIDEQKIEKMLSNEGNSAFNSLFKYERFGRISMIICLFLAFPLFEEYIPVLIIFVVLLFRWSLSVKSFQPF